MIPSAFFDCIHSWDEFVAATAALENHARGAPFERLVQHFLRFAPAYRTKLRHVWLLQDVPPEVREKLNLPRPDEGIDLIAETYAGEFWAIQAKYRSETDASLTHGELSTFTSLAFVVCRGIAFALVCTTTERVTDLLANVARVGELTAETWGELGADFFDSLRVAFATAAPPAPMAPRTPQRHQLGAITDALAHFGDKGAARGKLISPCGSGKSLTAYWIARDLGVRRVLIAVPSLALIRQTLETWMREALADGRAVDWLCVCSDRDVTLSENHERLAVPCDTAPAALAAHLSTLGATAGLQVVLTTYQSSPVLAEAARTAGYAFDFAVLDEAHKTTGKAAGVFAHFLDDANLPLPRRLFMTATERRFAGASDDIVSMDDTALYGETFSLLTFKAAIAAVPAILCDYRILTIGVRQSDVAALVAANRWLDLGPDGPDEITALALASLIALRRATAAHGVRHTVSFHSSIARASRFTALCNDLNAHLATETPIPAFHVSGKLGSGARQREIKAFLAAAPSLITNARCLTEGVDVPRIDCVFFADPKGSTIEIVQAAGRALRLAHGKTRGYILLPLVVPDGATLDEVTATSAFKFVLFVLRALAAHDERIIEWFRATVEGRTPEVGGLVDFDFENGVAPLGVDATQFANQIEVRCWESVAKLAYRSYEEAAAYARGRGIKSQGQWYKLVRAGDGRWPADIPTSPDSTYERKGWKSWGEFFGTGAYGMKLKQFRPFGEAREFIRSLNLKSSDEWHPYCTGKIPGKPQLPFDIPSTPERCKAYAEKWAGWADWLGYEDVRAPWRSFEQAREFARALKIPGQQHWKAYCAGKRPELPVKPDDIPAAPWKAYDGAGWISWGDWLGHGMVGTTVRNYLPYAEARDVVRALQLPSRAAWNALSVANQQPERVPRSPDTTYARKGWINWSDWLGVEVREIKRKRTQIRTFRGFESARAFVHALQLPGSLAWPRYLNGEFPDRPPLPSDIPRSPTGYYREQWRGWGDWLGTGTLAPSDRKFRSFEDARRFARGLGLDGGKAWRTWSKIPGNRPPDIPGGPDNYYKCKGWISWPDFLQAPTDEITPSPEIAPLT